jgi:hypothetical protein
LDATFYFFSKKMGCSINPERCSNGLDTCLPNGYAQFLRAAYLKQKGGHINTAGSRKRQLQ